MCLWTEKQGKDATTKKDKGSKKSLKSMGAKKTGIRGKRTEKEQMQPEQERLEKDDEEAHCNIHVTIKE